MSINFFMPDFTCFAFLSPESLCPMLGNRALAARNAPCRRDFAALRRKPPPMPSAPRRTFSPNPQEIQKKSPRRAKQRVQKLKAVA